MRTRLWGSFLLVLIALVACDRPNDADTVPQPGVERPSAEQPSSERSRGEASSTTSASAIIAPTTTSNATVSSTDLPSTTVSSAEPSAVSPQAAALNSSDNSPESALSDAVRQIRDEAYAKALEKLAIAAEQSPESAPVIQRLIANPAQAAQVFDSCPRDWEEFDPPADQPQNEWEVEEAKIFYGNFPELAEATRVYPIAAQKSLVVMVCVRGPYWVATANSIYDTADANSQIKPLVLPTFNRESKQVVPSESTLNYGFQDYDAENQSLTLVHRYRGVGDCGVRAVYELDNDEFVLQEFYEQAECDGSTLPGQFPQLYP